MIRRDLRTNLVFLSLVTFGCELIADFEKDRPSTDTLNAAGASAANGGATSSLAEGISGSGGTMGTERTDSVGGTTQHTLNSVASGAGGGMSAGSAASSMVVGAVVESFGGGDSSGAANNGGLSAAAGESNGAGTGTLGIGGATVGGSSANAGGPSSVGASSNPCASEPCLNGGLCSAAGSSYACKCVKGYIGATCDTPRFEWLASNCGALTLTSDGSVVAGFVGYPTVVPARWTRKTGFQRLQSLSGQIGSGEGLAINNDGSAIVGRVRFGTTYEAFWWNAKDGVASLGAGADSVATAVSSNGHIFGVMYDPDAPDLAYAFRWTSSGGLEKLFALGKSGEVVAASSDGTVVAGTYAPAGASLGSPFRWTATSGLVQLTDKQAFATAMSADGSTVVGRSFGEPFRFVTFAGYTALTLSSDLSEPVPMAINSDGSVIGGRDIKGAWLWNRYDGARLLHDILTEYGVDLFDWHLMSVQGISADGKVLVGRGFDGIYDTCWIARI